MHFITAYYKLSFESLNHILIIRVRDIPYCYCLLSSRSEARVPFGAPEKSRNFGLRLFLFYSFSIKTRTRESFRVRQAVPAGFFVNGSLRRVQHLFFPQPTEVAMRRRASSDGNVCHWQTAPRTPCSIRLLNINVSLEFVYSNRSGRIFSNFNQCCAA